MQGHGPVGLLPLFDSNIVEKQVQSVRNMGAEKIIFLCPTMHGALLQYTDILKGQGIDAEIVRNASDLGQYASREDFLIFLGDGIFPEHSFEEHLSGQSGELIYVVANADAYADFERIDLSHRWLGIALLRAERLGEISQIPDDWDIGSALLRTAVQSECRRELISDEDMRADAVPQLLNSEASITYAKRQLNKMEIPKQNFLDKFVVWPLMRRAIPSLWKAPETKKYIGIASMVCAVIAAGLGFIVSPAVSLGFLFVGALALALHNRIAIFSVKNGKPDRASPFFYLVAAIVLIIAVLRDGQQAALFADITILLLFFGNLWMVNTAPDHPQLNWMRPDILLVLIILLVSSAFGFFAIGLYISAILCVIYLIAARHARFISKARSDLSK
tara:strand:- start:631 stop:1797 length:1167 start_codon:yes stop_codon:yes gene_type:complete